MPATVESFIAKWAASGASERANKDAYLLELCDVLEVPRPSPTRGNEDENLYVFEKSVTFSHEGGIATVGKIDLYKSGCFILEAKQGSDDGSKRAGTARRGTPAWNVAMKDAYGQAYGYARSFDEPVPFLVVVDIGYCIDLYAAFDGSWNYRPFPNAQHSRLFHKDMSKHLGLLRQLFLDPKNLDPAKNAAKITKEVAAHLADLAKALEAKGHPQELVATFLMRCLFTMFAEDVGLLPEGCFSKAIRDFWLSSPASFTGGVEQLWRTMNEGGVMFGIVGKILKFNGGLFANPVALPLDKEELKLLLRAAECNWAEVEPAIFGTLLERALDPRERHRLGAHFTPRAYVERLVRPTIEEPLRAEWDVVQAQVRSLINDSEVAKSDKARKAKTAEAVAVVTEFQKHLAGIRVLDPACGSGNFLYVTLDLFKKLESEVLSLLESLGQTTLLHLETIRVTPAQFHGIEIKRWAKEIAELVLWIGYLQWHFRIYGKSLPVPEPVLRDYKNIECRDAVLAYDGEPELLRDDKGKPISRWDGESTKAHPITGEQVPDETKRVPVYIYKNPRRATWPDVDFIVGNPPFIGNKRMRLALGDGYVDVLRATYSELPAAIDYVVYWWANAAERLLAGTTRRFGLVSTNSIVQGFNQKAVRQLLDRGMRLAFAIADHPWVDSEDGAAVRIAMSVGAGGTEPGLSVAVVNEVVGNDDARELQLGFTHGTIGADFRAGAPTASCAQLQANAGICFTGMYPMGQGFIVMPDQVDQVTSGNRNAEQRLKLYFTARDLMQKPRGARAIDLFPLDEETVRTRYPSLWQWLFERVKPQRDQEKAKSNRERWWIFARPRTELRAALEGLDEMFLVPRTAKHFVFQPFGKNVAPDSTVVAIALSDRFYLGVLSSRIHLVWATNVGGHLGVGNDPRYQHEKTFNQFPFPEMVDKSAEGIRKLGDALYEHTRTRREKYPDLTLTAIYNILEKLRSGAPLTAKDKVIHEQGLVSVLRKIHDDLDAAVFAAYGWPHDLTDEQILERLVTLNAERAEEERKGLIRWLRPEFQNRGGIKAMTQTKLIATDDEDDESVAVTSAIAASWPKKLPDQIAAIRDLVTKTQADWTLEKVVGSFKGSKRPDVETVLDSLAALGLLVGFEQKGSRRWKATRFVV